MVLQKRLEYGFNGYQIPPTPRAPRSARKRMKRNENRNQMQAFDLLATIAGKLLSEGNNSADNTLSQEETVKETATIKNEENPSKGNDCDQESCNKSFFVSEIITKAPVNDTCSGPASGVTVSDFSEKVPENVVGCKIDINDKQMMMMTKTPVVDSLGSNVNLVVRDDDENSSWYMTQPQGLTNKTTFRPPSRIGDRRIRRLSASKQWKVGPKLNNNGVRFNTGDAEMKPVYHHHNKKTCYKHQRSLRDYPFKKRRLYQLENPSDSDNRSGSPRKGEDESSEDPNFQVQDSHVKLKIKSFRVPEFFIEIPETATVSSLKRTVMEAVTAIFSGELHVGVMLQGKRIRDDNKTLLQTGICHDDKLDALGFTLEPNRLQVPPSLCPEDRSPATTTPKTLTRYSPPESVVTNFRKMSEVDNNTLVKVPANGTLAVSKSKQAEAAQRRIRRPFSVSEVEALVEAVEKLGTGRWRDVKLRAFDDAKHRTYVDLKDKWKTLVHTARISPQQRRGEPVPQELLDRVLEAHAYWSNNNQFKTQTCRLL